MRHVLKFELKLSKEAKDPYRNVRRSIARPGHSFSTIKDYNRYNKKRDIEDSLRNG
jgi:hypothetical protein